MKSLNATPKQIGLIKLKEKYKLFIKPLTIKFSFEEYLEMHNIDLDVYLSEFEKEFNRFDFYKQKAKYNNNFKII